MIKVFFSSLFPQNTARIVNQKDKKQSSVVYMKDHHTQPFITDFL